ncbi:MAG: CotH kinase family protein, partial [Erysipelotrichales bacterium]|nr:CotH kinase family protein [Erysipelotrichales bacterium]
MSLNNLIQDTTLMKDYLAYQMIDDFGADAPLSSYVYITVNGEDWGLYLAVEAIEDAFLQRNYGSDYGELYKPDSMSFGGGRGNGKNFDVEDLDMGDFDIGNFDMGNFDFSNLPQGNWNGDRTSQREQGTTPDRSQTPSRGDSEVEPSDESSSTQRPSNFDFGNMGGMFGMGSSDVKLQYIDESYSSYSNIFNNAKTGITNADKDRLIDSLEKLSNQEDLENIVDIEEVIRYFVVHNFVVNGDSYTGSMIHNYYLYEEDGMLSMIPWDYNLAFGTFQGGMGSSAVNEDIDFELSDRPMVNWIFTNEEYTQMYYEYYAEFLEMFFANDELVNKINDTIEMITPYVEKDPTKFITMEEFEKGVETMKSFVELRSQSVALQLSGSDESVDASSISISDMGGMNMGGKGGMSFDRPEGMENFPSFNGNTTEGIMPSMPEGSEGMSQFPSAFNGQGGNFDPSQLEGMENFPSFNGNTTENTENNTTPQTKPNTTRSNRAPSSQGTSQNVPTDMSNILYLVGIFATLLFSILVVSKVKRRGF